MQVKVILCKGIEIEMKKSRRLICLSLVLSLLFSVGGSVQAGSIFTDMDDDSPYAFEAQLLKTLGIVSGDGDGSLRPDDNLSRAEFAKLAVCMLDKQKEAVSNSGSSTYSDVYADHWALRYINYVSKNQIILGYPDGTFHPDETISFAQAVTVTLRTLGYNAAEVGAFWPDNYIQKAASLGLTDGMRYAADDAITRADTVLMLGRALEADMSTSTPTAKKTLLDQFGYTVIDETTIISSQATDKSLGVNQVKTSSATYKTLTNDVFDMVGGMAKLYLDDEKRIVLAVPIEQYSYTMTIQKSLGDDEYTCLSAESDDEFDYTFDDNLTMYFEGKTGSYASLKENIEPGATVTFKGRYDGIWEYALLEKAAKITPVVAARDVQEGDTSIGGVTIENTEKLKIYRDGYRASLTDIKRNDVVYYNPATNTMDVYIDKVTGTYDKALPNKAHVTSIELGGKTFEIETRTATEKLDETRGSYQIGDRVTLLLGKDGQIAGVTNTTSDAALDYAVLINTSSEMSQEEEDKGKAIQKVKLMQTDGETYEYKADKDYASYKGELVKMTFTDGIVSLKKVSKASDTLSGYYDKTNKTIGRRPIADGVILFDRSANDAGQDAQVIKIEPNDVAKEEIVDSDIVSYVVTTDFGDIGIILFNNITKSNQQYGILTAKNVRDTGTSISASYTVNVRGVETTYATNSAYSGLSVGIPVKISANGQSLNSLSFLIKVGTASKVEAIDYNRIKINGTIYDMDEDVVIYRQDKRTLKYITAPQSDLFAPNVMSVELWADAALGRGGIVRIIKVTYYSN